MISTGLAILGAFALAVACLVLVIAAAMTVACMIGFVSVLLLSAIRALEGRNA